MILVREVFQLKFGKAKEAKVLVKESLDLEKKLGYGPSRYLTDLTGPYYTLIMETSYQSLAAFEQMLKEVMGNKEFSAWYQKFMPLVESGRREIFTIVE
jgi:hypothetical protein